MSKKIVAFIGLLFFIGLFATAFLFRSDLIEKDLQVRVAEALQDAGVDWCDVETDGRDVVIRGIPPESSAREAALRTAKGVWGVRVVIDQTTMGKDDARYTLVLNKTPTAVVMKGAVADDAMRDALLLEARSALGPNVEDKTYFAPEALGDDWQTAALVGIVQLQALDRGNMTLQGHHLSVRGKSQYPRLQERLQSAYEKLLPAGYTGSAEIEGISVEGVLPNEVKACRDRFAEVLDGHAIEFVQGSPVIRPAGVDLINRLAEAFKACAGTHLEISGYAVIDGDFGGQLLLSRKRVEAVAGSLQLAGVEASRLTVHAYGPVLPALPGVTEGGGHETTRIEFRFQPQKG